MAVATTFTTGNMITESAGVYYLDLSNTKIRNANVVLNKYTKGTEAGITIKFAKKFKDGTKAYVLDETNLANKTLKSLSFTATTTVIYDLSLSDFWDVDRFYVEVVTNTPGVTDGTLSLGVYPGKR